MLLCNELAEHGNVALGLDGRRFHRELPLQRLQHGRPQLGNLFCVSQARPILLQKYVGGIQRQANLKLEIGLNENKIKLTKSRGNECAPLASESCISARDFA